MIEYYVFNYNINHHQIEKYNVFKHSSFYKDMKKRLEQAREGWLSKERFAKEVDNLARYYFHHKCEYEILVGGNPPSSDNTYTKIDIYEQLKLNWDRFINYLWNKRFEEGR